MPEPPPLALINSCALAGSIASVIADIVRLLVNSPDQIDVKVQKDGETTTLLLAVAPDDVGKVVGKHGRTAHSLRVLVNAISSRTGVRFALDIHAKEP